MTAQRCSLVCISRTRVCGAAAFAAASSGIAIPLLLESCCRPSPCGRLSRPRTTTAAPPRPDPIGRRWTQPGDPRWRHGPWREPGRFPCSLIVAGRRRSPAIPPRHRHGYAADLHRGLPHRPS
jgi:hypothetical protein